MSNYIRRWIGRDSFVLSRELSPFSKRSKDHEARTLFLAARLAMSPDPQLEVVPSR